MQELEVEPGREKVLGRELLAHVEREPAREAALQRHVVAAVQDAHRIRDVEQLDVVHGVDLGGQERGRVHVPRVLQLVRLVGLVVRERPAEAERLREVGLADRERLERLNLGGAQCGLPRRERQVERVVVLEMQRNAAQAKSVGLVLKTVAQMCAEERVVVEELQRLVVVAAELVHGVFQEIFGGAVAAAVEDRVLSEISGGRAVRAVVVSAGVVFVKRRVAREPAVRRGPPVLGVSGLLAAAAVHVVLELAEVRVGTALRDHVDRAGAGVSGGRIARTGRHLELRRAVKQKAVDELVRERVGVVDAFELIAFLVLAAAAQHGIAGAVERRAGDRREQVGFVRAVGFAEDRVDLVRRHGVRVLRLLRLKRRAARSAAGAADVRELLRQRLRDADRLARGDRHAVDRRVLIAGAGERDLVGVGDDAGQREKAVRVRGRGVALRRRDGGDGDAAQRRAVLPSDRSVDGSGGGLRGGRYERAQHEREGKRQTQYGPQAADVRARGSTGRRSE